MPVCPSDHRRRGSPAGLKGEETSPRVYLPGIESAPFGAPLLLATSYVTTTLFSNSFFQAGSAFHDFNKRAFDSLVGLFRLLKHISSGFSTWSCSQAPPSADSTSELSTLW